jgi:alpha-D-xyloside xylohydrolase
MDFGVSDPSVLTNVNTASISLQYMFGPRLLVAPVTTYGQTVHSIYLPKIPAGASGNVTKWTYWWTNQTYDGGQTVGLCRVLLWNPD